MVDSASLLKVCRELFVQRDDTYAVDAQPNPKRMSAALSDDVLERHLQGQIRIISYPKKPGDTLETRLLMFDIDARGARHESGFESETAERYAARIHDALVERRFHPLVERSRSGGWHVWIFFETAVAVPTAKRWGEELLHELGIPRLEVFPMGGRGKPFGRAPFLPLHGALNGQPAQLLNRIPEGFEPVADAAAALSAVRRCPAPEIKADRDRPKPKQPHSDTSRSTRYGRTAALKEAERLRNSTERNVQLFKSAAALGELVAGGELTREETYDALRGAGEANGMIQDDGEWKFNDTFDRGFEAGSNTPRQAPSPSSVKSVGGRELAYPNDAGWRDATMGKLFVDLYSNKARFDHNRGNWLLWDRTHWRVDDVAGVLQLARDAAERALQIAHRLGRDDTEKVKQATSQALKYWHHRPMENMLRQAASMHPIGTTIHAWNSNPWLLNCANGTLNLRTGELRPHDPKDLFDYVLKVPYDADAICPRWEQFLLEVFESANPVDTLELIDWIQKAIGWSLTGDSSEAMFFVLFGLGENGKTVFLEILLSLFGALARAASVNTLMSRDRKGGEHSEDVARLAGARFVTCSEFPENRRLNESLIKDLTGGDQITARFMYKPTFEFTFTGSIWVRANHKPLVTGDDEGIWRRMKLIRFPRSFKGDPRRDPHLRDKLTLELPGILAWAIRGLRAWETDRGIGTCRVVEAEVRSYRQEMDLLAAFLKDHCEVGKPNHVTSRAALYSGFCKVYGRTLSANQLTRRMRRRIEQGAIPGVSESGRNWIGVRLIPEDES